MSLACEPMENPEFDKKLSRILVASLTSLKVIHVNLNLCDYDTKNPEFKRQLKSSLHPVNLIEDRLNSKRQERFYEERRIYRVRKGFTKSYHKIWNEHCFEGQYVTVLAKCGKADCKFCDTICMSKAGLFPSKSCWYITLPTVCRRLSKITTRDRPPGYLLEKVEAPVQAC